MYDYITRSDRGHIGIIYIGSGYFILVVLKDMQRLYNAGHDAERKCDNTAIVEYSSAIS